ncbi:MAG: leucine-rich repeat protein [Bacteroidales bacterium]|nr:leucine-rich repeat protein [Bacteroidales bacterium]
MKKLLCLLAVLSMVFACDESEEAPAAIDDNLPQYAVTFVSTGTSVLSLQKNNSFLEVSLEYKTKDTDWSPYTVGTPITIGDGEYVAFRAGDAGNTGLCISANDFCHTFKNTGSGTLVVSGNIMSLLNKTQAQAKIPSNYCFGYLFAGLKSLTDASGLLLPATTLREHCYEGMFRLCTGLKAAPALPATTLANECYSEMFYSCTALKTAPALPAQVMAVGCYRSMFSRCTALVAAPELPAQQLATECYSSMFYGCTALETAPALPATTLADLCYVTMFSGCTALRSAPDLPALQLVSACYYQMFQGCSSLNYVKALFLTKPGIDFTRGWMNGVASTGTFVKHLAADWDVTGPDGVPQGWNVETPGDVSEEYAVTFTSTGTSVISLKKNGTPNDISLEYKISDGTWGSYTIGDAITIADGKSVSFRAGEGGNKSIGKTQSDYYYFSGTGPGTVVVSGNIMALLSQTPGATLQGMCSFAFLFDSFQILTDASALLLPAATLTMQCYSNMFQLCFALKTPPVLPATTLAMECYQNMFLYCYALETAPALPATTLVKHCYANMFGHCKVLKKAPVLPAMTLADACYAYMFDDCTALEAVPDFPATKAAYMGYISMFRGCTALKKAPALPAMTLENSCYRSMFEDCTALETAPDLPATTLVAGCYNKMFSGCTALKTVKALFLTEPGEAYTDDWLAGVSSTGTFVKNSKATWDVTGPDGVPEGWTVQTAAY